MKTNINFSEVNLKSQVENNGSNDNPKLGTSMGNNIYEVTMDLVELHPSVMKVYMTKNLKGLKVTMNLVGQLEPIKVVIRDGKYLIFDGISRYLAAIELGWKTIFVEVFDYTEDEIQNKFVLHNFRTKRSIKELCRQAEVVLGILGLSQGKKREKIGDLALSDEDFGLVGKDRFELACAIIDADISPSSLRRLLDVKHFEENGNDEVNRFELIDKIDRGEMKIHQAFGVISNYKKAKEEQGSNSLTEAMKVVKGKNFKLYNQTCGDLNDIPDESIDCVVTSPPYFQLRKYPDGVRDLNEIQHGLEDSVDAYIQKEVEILSGVFKKLKNTGSLFINITDSYHERANCLVVEKLILELFKSGWFLNQKIYGLKDNPKPHSVDTKRLMPTYEYILHFVKDTDAFYYREFRIWKDREGYGLGRGCHDTSPSTKSEHKTWWLKKPLFRFRNFLSEQNVIQVIHANGFNWAELKEIDPAFRHLAPYPSVIPLLPILLTTRIGDTVLDIFNGTSTTTAVALQLGRKAIGYDTDTESHVFAAKRLQMVEENMPTNQEVIEFENEFMVSPTVESELNSETDPKLAA